MRASAEHSKTVTWLEYVVSADPGVMTRLPSLYLKCTSMIMDTVNFSIDYATPLIQRALRVKSPAIPTLSGGQNSPSAFDCNNKITPQTLNMRSNVKMTLRYLGSGFSMTSEIINPKDELSMFQQICGGESICVYKGYLSPGDSFHIISRRHYGYPFSASIYINGLIAARISWCCEYRHHVGFQQGRRGCFQITQLSGGRPCYRCGQLNKKFKTRSGRKQSSGSTGEGSALSQEKANHKAETMRNMEAYIWEPHNNLYPVPPNTQSTPSVRKRRLKKKKTQRKEESDSEQENKVQLKPRRRRRGSRTNCRTQSLKEEKSEQPEAAIEGRIPGAPVHSRAGAAHIPRRTKNKISRDQGESGAANGEQDMDPGSRQVEEGPNGSVREIHRRLMTAASERNVYSEVELSDSSDSTDNPSGITVLEQQVAVLSQEQISEGLVSQIADLIAVLQECDEVHELVLRNTGMTDALLHHLAPAISTSKSAVETINLNLNEIGPNGAKTMVRLLRDKPCVKSLLLYGNHLGAAGVQTIMAGLSDLWFAVWGGPSDLSPHISGFQLTELDIGGNQMDSEGLRSVANLLKRNPPLRHLCLAQSSVASTDVWAELFDAIKENTNLTHLLLDENSLGDPGAKLVAEVMQVNHSLRSLDLDSNDIGEEGGRAIIESLRVGSLLTSISLENNPISAGTIDAINRSLANRSR